MLGRAANGDGRNPLPEQAARPLLYSLSARVVLDKRHGQRAENQWLAKCDCIWGASVVTCAVDRAVDVEEQEEDEEAEESSRVRSGQANTMWGCCCGEGGGGGGRTLGDGDVKGGSAWL